MIGVASVKQHALPKYIAATENLYQFMNRIARTPVSAILDPRIAELRDDISNMLHEGMGGLLKANKALMGAVNSKQSPGDFLSKRYHCLARLLRFFITILNDDWTEELQAASEFAEIIGVANYAKGVIVGRQNSATSSASTKSSSGPNAWSTVLGGSPVLEGGGGAGDQEGKKRRQARKHWDTLRSRYQKYVWLERLKRCQQVLCPQGMYGGFDGTGSHPMSGGGSVGAPSPLDGSLTDMLGATRGSLASSGGNVFDASGFGPPGALPLPVVTISMMGADIELIKSLRIMLRYLQTKRIFKKSI